MDIPAGSPSQVIRTGSCSEPNLQTGGDLEDIYYKEGEQLNPNFARYLEECNSNTITTVSTGNLEAKGFVRVKMANRNIITKVLIDSGNLFGTLMSESFCKRLSLPIVGKQLSVGTASKSGHVVILGRTKPLKIYLENIKRVITIQPYVVKDLAHTINLGSHFLRQNLAELTFKPTGVALKMGNDITILESGRMALERNSLDIRFQPVLDKYRSSGMVAPSSIPGERDILDLRTSALDSDPEKSEESGVRSNLFLGEEYDFIPGVQYKSLDKRTSLNFGNKPGYRVISASDYELYPGTDTVVELITTSRKKSQPKNPIDVVFEPACDRVELLEAEILPYVGLCTLQGDNKLKIKVGNYSNSVQNLKKGWFIGYIHECQSEEKISVLDHRPSQKLTDKDLQERKEFIEKSLKLNENSLLQSHSRIKDELIMGLLANFDCVSVSDSDFGKTSLMTFNIELKPGSEPVNQKVRPLNPKQEADLRRQLDDWLAADIIEPSSSPFASALVPVSKKGTDKIRWCIDYRALNALTVRDRYPLPNIENNLNKLAKAKVYTSIDSAGAFHCLPISKEDMHKTSFVSPHGSFQFKYLPFGLCNAPSAYSRLIDKALGHLPADFRLAYIDDVIIYSKTVQEHLGHIMQVLRAHVTVGMKLNLKKCHFFQERVEYLGHEICPKGISMIPRYIQRIQEWPLPENGKELARFLGFTSYYRSFIPAYSHLTNELNGMKKLIKISWTPELVAKVKTLKEMFKESPLRAFPDYTSPNPFVLYIDFSSTNLAAVLTQVQQDHKEHLIGCVAHKTTKGQSNYPSWKGELAALVLGLRKWEHILRYKKFIVRSDSQSIRDVQKLKDELMRGMIFRWTTFIQSFDFEFQHIAGKKNILADSLSRIKDLSPPYEEDKFDILYNEEVEDICALRAKLPVNKIAEGQKTDFVLAKIIEMVRTKAKLSHHKEKTLGSELLDYLNVFGLLKLDKGVLYYKTPDRNGKKGLKRICVPKVYRNEIFTLMHCNPLVGHRGIEETYQKIRERYFWPHLKHYISIRVNNCLDCLQKKFTYDGTKNYEMHREIYSYFGQRLCIDHCIMSRERFQNSWVSYILTMQDSWTRYLVAVPVSSVDAETTAKAVFQHWILRFGVCEQLHSDRGSAFISEVFQSIMKSMGITKSFTPPYSPQGNQVERAHDTLKKILRSDITVGTSSWVERLPYAVFAYNIATNRVTGVSPYFSLFGRSALLPADLLFPLPQENDRREAWIDYVLNIRGKFGDIAEKMAKSQLSTIELEQAKHQTNITKKPFDIGDKVAMFIHNLKPGVSRKIQRRWSGPWEIVRKCSASLYVIRPFGNWAKNKKEILCTLARLRPWCVDWPSDHGSDEWISDLVSDEEEFEGISFPEKEKSPSSKSSTRSKPEIRIQPSTPEEQIWEEEDFSTPDNTLIEGGDLSSDQLLPQDITQIPLQRGLSQDSPPPVDTSMNLQSWPFSDDTFAGGPPREFSTPTAKPGRRGRPKVGDLVQPENVLEGGRLRSTTQPPTVTSENLRSDLGLLLGKKK